MLVEFAVGMTVLFEEVDRYSGRPGLGFRKVSESSSSNPRDSLSFSKIELLLVCSMSGGSLVSFVVSFPSEARLLTVRLIPSHPSTPGALTVISCSFAGESGVTKAADALMVSADGELLRNAPDKLLARLILVFFG